MRRIYKDWIDNFEMGIVPSEPNEYITAWKMTLKLLKDKT